MKKTFSIFTVFFHTCLVSLIHCWCGNIKGGIQRLEKAETTAVTRWLTLRSSFKNCLHRLLLLNLPQQLVQRCCLLIWLKYCCLVLMLSSMLSKNGQCITQGLSSFINSCGSQINWGDEDWDPAFLYRLVTGDIWTPACKKKLGILFSSCNFELFHMFVLISFFC